MAHRAKQSFRSWMIVYLSLAAALAAAGGERVKPTAVLDVSPILIPAALPGADVFFAPAGPTVRRNDI